MEEQAKDELPGEDLGYVMCVVYMTLFDIQTLLQLQNPPHLEANQKVTPLVENLDSKGPQDKPSPSSISSGGHCQLHVTPGQHAR